MPAPAFLDRRDAGRCLAGLLAHLKDQDPVVLALPRGGVPVAAEVARALDAPLDVLLVRKIGAPDNPEYGIGAVVEGETPETVLNDELVRLTAAPPGYVAAEAARQAEEIARRRALYGRAAPVPVSGRTAILVDDGIATGGTARAALRALRRRFPRRIVLAVPVAPEDTLESLAGEADEIVCPVRPGIFHAVGQQYRDFTQVEDAEVLRLLRGG